MEFIIHKCEWCGAGVRLAHSTHTFGIYRGQCRCGAEFVGRGRPRNHANRIRAEIRINATRDPNFSPERD